MNKIRRIRRNFSFMWDGIIHLEDGSEWRLTDQAGRHDVIWWQTGEEIQIVHGRGVFVLRNVTRDEAVTIAEASEGILKLAA